MKKRSMKPTPPNTSTTTSPSAKPPESSKPPNETWTERMLRDDREAEERTNAMLSKIPNVKKAQKQ